jgi:hypothetical protein
MRCSGSIGLSVENLVSQHQSKFCYGVGSSRQVNSKGILHNAPEKELPAIENEKRHPLIS